MRSLWCRLSWRKQMISSTGGRCSSALAAIRSPNFAAHRLGIRLPGSEHYTTCRMAHQVPWPIVGLSRIGAESLHSPDGPVAESRRSLLRLCDNSPQCWIQ